MSERKTTYDLGTFLVPLFSIAAVPALFLLALIIGQAVIYGGWR